MTATPACTGHHGHRPVLLGDTLPAGGEPVAVIRQRTRSDYEFPDLGQMLTWRLCWRHTAMLIDDRRGNCEWDITGTSRRKAEQIAAGLAACNWPPDAARLPWAASAYPQ
jgi:hypothetical protein